MAKVYCKDCRHRLWFKSKFWRSDYCLDNNSIRETGYLTADWCETKNANNDCKDFKRKWWKVWIRN